MSFLALLFALLIEQARPLSSDNGLRRLLRSWITWISRTLDAGHHQLAWTTWSLAVGVPTLVTLSVHWLLLYFLGWPVAMVWSVCVLYASLGFRQFSHHFTDIRDALDAGDERLARELLAQWQHVSVGSLPRSDGLVLCLGRFGLWACGCRVLSHECLGLAYVAGVSSA
jgi:adenosylcobinamide-phosphate synthase